MAKCKNCKWEGDNDKIIKARFCPICGDNVSLDNNIPKQEKIEKVAPLKASETVSKKEDKLEYDLNGDGKVDKEDASIAAKVLRNTTKKKKTKRGKR